VSDWQRETRVCSSIAVQPDLLAAIRAYIEEHELAGLEAQALICFETVSRRTKKPSLTERMAGAGHKALAQAVIVTPTRLLWAQRAGDNEAFATSELLAKLEVSDYEKSPEYGLIADHGVKVAGIVSGEGRVGELFFGMGEGPDADKARAVLKAAVKAAHGEGPAVAAD
jgi:hypothetical protein